MSGGNPSPFERCLPSWRTRKSRRRIPIRRPRLAIDAGRGHCDVLLQTGCFPKEALELARAVAILGASTGIRLARQIPGLSIDEATEAVPALIRAGYLIDDKTLTLVIHWWVWPVTETSPALNEADGITALLACSWTTTAPESELLRTSSSPSNGDSWTVERLREIAAAAAARGAVEIAGDCLRRALAEPPSDATRPVVLLELGQIEVKQDPAAAVPHLGEAHASVEDRSLRAVVARRSAKRLPSWPTQECTGRSSEAASKRSETSRPNLARRWRRHS